MTLIVDSCSIILLAKATVLEELAKWKKILITAGAYEEVIEGKEKKYLDALLLERLVAEQKIKIRNKLNRGVVKKLSADFGLGIGEAESIALALEETDLSLVTDNKQGRKTAKVYGLALAGSVETVVAMHKTKKISKEKAINSLRILKNAGWFQNYLIEKAFEEVQNE